MALFFEVCIVGIVSFWRKNIGRLGRESVFSLNFKSVSTFFWIRFAFFGIRFAIFRSTWIVFLFSSYLFFGFLSRDFFKSVPIFFWVRFALFYEILFAIFAIFPIRFAQTLKDFFFSRLGNFLLPNGLFVKKVSQSLVADGRGTFMGKAISYDFQNPLG